MELQRVLRKSFALGYSIEHAQFDAVTLSGEVVSDFSGDVRQLSTVLIRLTKENDDKCI
jgi:hypothetical protein